MDFMSTMGIEAAKVTQSGMPLSFEKAALSPSERPDSFKSMLAGAVNQIEDLNADRKEMIQGFIGGENIDMHQIMIAGAKEDVLIKAASTVTTKVAAAYQTLMNIQV